ncbi:MAG: FAD-dependent oxidoreductase, partial [Candidatus Puniceispirillaceae bacterium]
MTQATVISKETELQASANLPATARVVVIGGGAVGCSVLYNLAEMGWSDCVLLEKNELT